MNIEPDIRNEEILLLELCRLEFSMEQTEKMKTLATTLADWRYFADLANAHGVGALVYYNLEKLGFLQYVPRKAIEFLRNVLIMSLTRNTHLINEIKKVLSLLNNAGIKTVLLKGMALEITVYGNKGLRQMTDADVLITKDNCIKARRLLMANGFTSLPVKSVFHKLIIAHTGKHLPSLLRNEFSFDIHHELFGADKNVLTKMFYDSSYETELNGEKAFVPRAQIFFLYLIKHLWLHEMNNESQLRLYTDLVVLIEKFKDEIISHDLSGLANQAGMNEILAWKLEHLRDIWGIPFPAWVNDFIEKRHNPDSVHKFIFFLKSPKGNPAPDKATFYRYNLNEIPGIHRKFFFVLGDLFPTIEFMKKRYNCKSGWKALLYYPHRFGKLWYLIK